MSLFFNFQTQSDVVATVLLSRWHTLYPLLAVATGPTGAPAAADAGGEAPSSEVPTGPTTARVTVYNEEGDKVGNPEERGCVCSSFAWHPRLKVLCTAWRDGSIHLWTEEGQSQSVASTGAHSGKHPITTCCWTSSGDKLLTTDRSGVWAVWKFDPLKKGLTLVVHNKDSPLESGHITHSVFRTRARDRLITTAADAEEKGAGDDEKGMQKLDVQDEEADVDAYGGTAFQVTRFNEEATWYMGTQSGAVLGVDEDGQCQPIFTMEGSPVVALLFHYARTGVVAMSQSHFVSYYIMMDDHRWMQQMRFKVSFGPGAEPSQLQMIWIGNGIVGTCAHESVVRCWNIEANEMYVIQMESQDLEGYLKTQGQEKIMCIGYNPRKRVLCAGTREKRVVFWQYVGAEISKSEEDWEPLAEITLENGPVNEISWGPGESLLSVAMPEAVSVLHETALQRKVNKGRVVVQLTPDTVHFEDLTNKTMVTAKSSLRIKGVDLAGQHLVVWNHKEIELFLIQNTTGTVTSKVQPKRLDNSAVALYEQKVFVACSKKELGKVEIHNDTLDMAGGLKITQQEGLPTHLNVNGEYLVTATNKTYIKCWWCGSREPRVHQKPKMIWEERERREITNVAVNCDGTRVAFTAKRRDESGHSIPDSSLHVYDMVNDKLHSFDFAEWHRHPISLFWDDQEKTLLACETRRMRFTEGPEGSNRPKHIEEETDGPSRLVIASLFASDKGVRLQEQFPLDKTLTALIGISVPDFVVYCREAIKAEGVPPTKVVRRRMRDFEGIDCTDPKKREAMLSFSYNLAMGDMDAAYRAVKLIKDENVWTNMAKSCVKTRRLDVAEVCLGNMQDAKGARALREARQEPEIEAQVAMLAIQLGLNDEAEDLYKKCGRYDLLGQLYQAQNKWEQAIKVAEENDRIHLRTVHYCHARHLESLGKTDEAIKAYEDAKCHGYEVPRMLFDLNMIDELDRYVTKTKDKDVYMWWAQFCESNQQCESALHFYKEAGDMLNPVRLYCFSGDYETAAQHIEEYIDKPEFVSQCRAAAFHLARQHEERGSTQESLHFFRVAKAYRNAIRLARSNQLDTEVMQLSLQASDNATMIESAQWFEEQKMLDKAVTLYQRGGEQAKAIELCVEGELYDVLQKLADNLDKDTEPEVFVRCAEYFAGKGQFAKASAMYISARSYDAALQLCIEHNVKLTDEMAEEMTLPKTENEDDEALRTTLLKKIAKVAKVQESWHLACKKYTQAGDRLKGMKVLLKSGDTERIIFFTNHSRQKEIYIVAANYLQTLDWHNPDKPHLIKNIITFYSKARAFESLAGFYDAMSQVDIDEYRDYKKALEGLREAAKYLEKSKAQNREQKVAHLDLRIKYVGQFVEARTLVNTAPEKMVELCNQLLEKEDVEGSVRVGDVFALLVEFYVQRKENEKAYELVEKMRERQIILNYYLETQLIQSVYEAMGVEYREQEAQPAGVPEVAPEDEVGEDISPAVDDDDDV
eukprot:Hpha_TRINITY_DN13742_c1_g2::TRINITY_DN13742_c1_g2_i1::g.142675::m.142675/K19672/IFT140; intraflagellar transport protein 140